MIQLTKGTSIMSYSLNTVFSIIVMEKECPHGTMVRMRFFIDESQNYDGTRIIDDKLIVNPFEEGEY